MPDLRYVWVGCSWHPSLQLLWGETESKRERETDREIEIDRERQRILKDFFLLEGLSSFSASFNKEGPSESDEFQRLP